MPGKGWYKPQTDIYKGAAVRSTEQSQKALHKGGRSLREMKLGSLSSDKDIQSLNTYLWDLRNAIVSQQVDGKFIIVNTISSGQIASGSIGGSCLADNYFTFSDPLCVSGGIVAGTYISATTWLCAGTGVKSLGIISAAGDIDGASGEFHSGINTSFLSCTGRIDTDTLVAATLLSTTGSLSVNGAISAQGDIEGASGEFHDGINTTFLSSVGDVIGNGYSLSAAGSAIALGCPVSATVENNSASWGSGGAWAETASGLSGYWEDTHTTVSANSSDWEAATTQVENTSACWNSACTWTQTASSLSGYWMSISGLSGDLQAASLSVSGDVTGASGEFHDGINTTFLSCYGHMRVTGGISASNNIFTGQNLYLNYDQPFSAVNAYIYVGSAQGTYLMWAITGAIDDGDVFYFTDGVESQEYIAARTFVATNADAATSSANCVYYFGNPYGATYEYLRWENTGARFEFSDDVYVGGNVSGANGIYTGMLSTGGDIIAASSNFAHGYTGSFTVDGGVNTAYVSSGVIVAVE